MSYFEFSRTGASCKQNRTYVMQLLECFGLDFESSRCVEDEGDLVLFKADFSGGGSGSRDELTDLFHIANTLFGEVFIYCGQCDGDTVSDGYSRHEEVNVWLSV